jgi:hypothetical protein
MLYVTSPAAINGSVHRTSFDFSYTYCTHVRNAHTLRYLGNTQAQKHNRLSFRSNYTLKPFSINQLTLSGKIFTVQICCASPFAPVVRLPTCRAARLSTAVLQKRVPRSTTSLPHHGRPHAPTAFFVACSSLCTVVMVVDKQTMDTNDSPANFLRGEMENWKGQGSSIFLNSTSFQQTSEVRTSCQFNKYWHVVLLVL